MLKCFTLRSWTHITSHFSCVFPVSTENLLAYFQNSPLICPTIIFWSHFLPSAHLSFKVMYKFIGEGSYQDILLDGGLQDYGSYSAHPWPSEYATKDLCLIGVLEKAGEYASWNDERSLCRWLASCIPVAMINVPGIFLCLLMMLGRREPGIGHLFFYFKSKQTNFFKWKASLFLD